MSDSAPESLINPAPEHPDAPNPHVGGPAPAAVATRDRLTAVIEILLCSSIPTQLAIGALLRLGGMHSTDAAGHLSFPFVLALSLTDTIVLIVMMVLLIHAHGESARGLWLGPAEARGPRSARDAMMGLPTVPFVFVAVGVGPNAIRLFAPSLHNVPTNPLEALAADRVEHDA